MWIQKSFQESDHGMLYIVPTPIGNLEDITYRSLKILKEVDLIAAEDTRQTKKLCNYFDIETKLVSYHEHNKESSGSKLIELMNSGKKIALVSDAGMPAISDPGFELVSECIDMKIPVIPLPGANAALLALVASGITTDHFFFFGFLNRSKKEKKKELEKLKAFQYTIIFYESPHRLKDTLNTILNVLGDRKISICRELTKKFEEFVRGTLSEVLEHINEVETRGEYCIVLEGNSQEEENLDYWWKDLTIEEHVNHHVSLGNSLKESIKQAALDRNMPKRDVYQLIHTK
ncbi:MAG: 16S rRNA (cytidine(1402)-2'-O)-methyltransferase [Bacillaceae bacterium]|nr:16S rRNA (cytidine(1402)-2'-O)-methyltransferase [Bacillaceae bacterium]